MNWIETTATVVQSVAVAAAGYAAWHSLTVWRREMPGRRKAELADHTLAMFYEARDIISAARFPGSFGGEGSSRERQPDETEDDANYRDSLYVPVERLTRQAEFWGCFEAARFPYIAVFGEEAATPFQNIREVVSRVKISAGMLVRTHGQVNEDREERQHQRE